MNDTPFWLPASSAKPDYTLAVEVPVTPARALATWSDPATAKATNPLISSVVVERWETLANGKIVVFSVTDNVPISRCLPSCTIPVTFPGTFWIPLSSGSYAGLSAAGDTMLYSYAPAACGVTVVNRWRFIARGQGVLVQQDTWVAAPSLLQSFVVNTARAAHQSGLQKTAAILRDSG